MRERKVSSVSIEAGVYSSKSFCPIFGKAMQRLYPILQTNLNFQHCLKTDLGVAKCLHSIGLTKVLQAGYAVLSFASVLSSE
jgi:hypothetical protein